MKRATLIHRICAALVGLTFSLAAPAAVSGAHASDPPNGQFNGVSCAGVQLCVAVGVYQRDANIDAIANVGSRQNWRYSTPAVPAAAQYSTLSDVSCPSVHWCVAVGDWSDGTLHPLFDTFDGSHWTPQRQLFPYGFGINVSCTSTTFCMASVRTSENEIRTETWNGTSWHAAGQIRNAGGYLKCSAPTFCVAYATATRRAATAVWDAIRWTAIYDPLLQNVHANDVSCAGTRCILVGYDGNLRPFAATPDGHRWTDVSPPPPPPSTKEYVLLDFVSCRNANSCLAIGHHYFSSDDHECCPAAYSWNGADWTSVPAPQDALYLTVGFRPDGDLDCHLANTCVEVGLSKQFQPAIQARINGTWVDGGAAQPPNS